MEKLLRYAEDFTNMAREFQARGDLVRMIECLALASQCLQAARAFQEMREARTA